MKETDADEVPRFRVQFNVKMIGGRMSGEVLEFREDLKELTDNGKECDE